jgi:hypothetical protein
MKTFQVTVLLFLVVALLVFVYTRRRSAVALTPTSKSGAAAGTGRQGLTGREALVLLDQLIANKAQWPEIQAVLNQANDPQIHQYLLRLRGPHLFNPGLALNVAQCECKRLMIEKPFVMFGDVLHSAVQSMERITRFGD